MRWPSPGPRGCGLGAASSRLTSRVLALRGESLAMDCVPPLFLNNRPGIAIAHG
jgi:hypothetical protein